MEIPEEWLPKSNYVLCFKIYAFDSNVAKIPKAPIRFKTNGMGFAESIENRLNAEVFLMRENTG